MEIRKFNPFPPTSQFERTCYVPLIAFGRQIFTLASKQRHTRQEDEGVERCIRFQVSIGVRGSLTCALRFVSCAYGQYCTCVGSMLWVCHGSSLDRLPFIRERRLYNLSISDVSTVIHGRRWWRQHTGSTPTLTVQMYTH